MAIDTSALLLFMLLSVYSDPVHSGMDVGKINVNGIQQQLPSKLADANLTLDDAKSLIRDKCNKEAGIELGEAAYKEIEASTVTLGECVSGIVNYTIIQGEIEKASPLGELDVVFNKYCLKRPEAVECIEKFNGKLAPCLDNEEKENQELFMRIVRSLLNFICHKGGDQIALFVAENGPECLESKKDEIQHCINSTFSSYIPEKGLENVKTLPKLVMGPKQCEELEILENCIVQKLETCNDITPANIIESMFRFIKNETICRTTLHGIVAKQSDNAGGVAFLNINNAALVIIISVSLFFNCKLAKIL